MHMKRNLLESLTIISSIGSTLCVILNYIINISPLIGVWFHLYICALFIVSVLSSFKCIQWLLHLNKPLKYDLQAIVRKYPYLSLLKRALPESRKQLPNVWKEYDTNELSVISTVLERKLVSSWYVPYVSQEIGFPFACKQMLDQMIGKAFKICHKIETKEVFVDMCTITITHLKEYKKALKRQEKSPFSAIESLYKMSHPISEGSTKYTSADHCTNIVRIIMKELVPWELWDTPHSELLVRILSKKLDSFIDSTLADPVWLNDKLMTYLTGEEYKKTETVDKVNGETSILDIKEVNGIPVVNNDEVNEELNGGDNVEMMESIVEERGLHTPVPLDVKSSPVLRQKRGRQGRNEVKIYDRIIEGSVKTWETDMDLQCISMGQDLLASLDGEITLSRLWGQDGEAEGSPERQGGKSPQPLWFGEEESLETEREGEGRSAREASVSGRVSGGGSGSGAASDVLKDLHTTVSSAKHKIGDLQVLPHARSDEAAGMMEGLLDFGIAGLKKGLRFTGLSDDSQEKSPSHRERSDKSPPDSRHRVHPELHKDIEITNGAVPPLLKQHRVSSQDSVGVSSASVTVPGEVVAGRESPEPEYEEAADLSTSIAKLRCLLRQRAGDPTLADPSPDHAADPARGEEIWWEGAEETRGRTQHRHSSRPVDTATLADEYDMSMDRNSSPNQTSNNMQRLDKLFQRTVTGVFNSLKTAVGGEEEPSPGGRGTARAPMAWSYVCAGAETGAGGGAAAAAARLQAARRSLAHVDAALDSLDMHTGHAALDPAAALPTDTDDLEEWLGACGRAWSGAMGVACAACPTAHVAARLATVLLADLGESFITSWLDEMTSWLRAQVFAAFRAAESPPAPAPASAPSPRPLHLPDTLAMLAEKVPALGIVFGSEVVADCVQTAGGSITHKSINRDVCYRAADLLVLHFTHAARPGLNNPVFDHN